MKKEVVITLSNEELNEAIIKYVKEKHSTPDDCFIQFQTKCVALDEEDYVLENIDINDEEEMELNNAVLGMEIESVTVSFEIE